MASSPTLTITPEVVREHGITPDEYEKIRLLLGGREPSITELGIFSVMWSEHCSYKSSRVHLKRLPTRSKLVLQGPGENAGADAAPLLRTAAPAPAPARSLWRMPAFALTVAACLVMVGNARRG